MPTRDRREFIPAAVACFEAQTYPNKELIVVDNGDSIRDLLPDRATYLHVGKEKLSTGEMRNKACELARGPICCHWDDDDYSHPERIREQMKLMTGMPVAVTGYNTMFFIEESERKAWLYRNLDLYALGTSLMYRRDYWRGGKFPDKNVAEDSAFIERAQERRSMAVRNADDRMVARVHGGNTCDKKQYMTEPMWTPVDFGFVARMINV